MGHFLRNLLVTTFFFVAASQSALSAPANDLFVNRIAIAGTNVTVSGNNFAAANNESGEPSGTSGAMLLYSVWYSWTAPASGVIYVSGNTSVYHFLLSATAYRGAAVNALTLAPSGSDGSCPVVAGETIAIQVATVYYPGSGVGGGSGAFTLNVRLEQPAPTSPNDSFANATEITMPYFSFEGSINGATNEPGEPLPSASLNRTLWWRFSAVDSGLIEVMPNAPSFTNVVRQFEGKELNALTLKAPFIGNLHSVEAGKDYAIQMAAGDAPFGGFSFSTRFYSSTNDSFAGSERVEGTNITYYGNFSRATSEPGEPLPAATNTVWMSWAAPANGAVTVKKATSYQFQHYYVYTGSIIDRLIPVKLVSVGGNNTFRFLATEGTVYHFQFSGGAHNFVFDLQFAEFGKSPNDNFENAEFISLGYVPRSVVGATMQLGEPAHMGAVPTKSLWWKWQASHTGNWTVSAPGSLLTNIVTSVYRGSSVESLTLLGRGTNQVTVPVTGGDSYYFAAAVPADAIGDIFYAPGYASRSSATQIVPGNLLREPSWEGTAILSSQYWGMSGGVGGYVNENGSCDGTTWPALSSGAKIWQDVVVTPGRFYRIRFAYRVGGNLSSCCGDTQMRVWWGGNDVGTIFVPAAENGYWRWSDFIVPATAATTRFMVENIARNVEVDAFSIIELNVPPSIVTQPVSISTYAGGTAAFIVGIQGSEPLHYQWYFNGAPLNGQNSRILLLEPVSTSQAGDYRVVVTNNFGSITSSVASLVVDSASTATILVQPYGGTVPAGSYFNLNVVAAGVPPLTYQWFYNDESIAGATNRNLMFPSVQHSDAGKYQVRVMNYGGATLSLPANLVVTNAAPSLGTINFRNKFYYTTNVDAPVLDIDGTTRLNGSNFVAQLYAGPSLELLRPMSVPTPFYAGFNAGYFMPQVVSLPTVPPGGTAFAQVRVWEENKGATFEEARAFGGRFGKSQILSVVVGGDPAPPAYLAGLRSFNLQAGLPQFTIGIIRFVARGQENTAVWSHEGQVGYRYVIEKKINNSDWEPFIIVRNTASLVNFTDTANSGANVVFYRSRILD